MTCFVLAVIIGCGKNEETNIPPCPPEGNHIPPTITIIQPAGGILIEKDTVLSITLEATDGDCSIAYGYLLHNGNLVGSFNLSPLKNYLHITKYDNGDMNSLKAIAFDNEDSVGIAEITFSVNIIDNSPDYRDPYIGHFYFRTIHSFWVLNEGTTVDTSYYHGMTRKFEQTDSADDLNIFHNDTGEDPENKITIEFREQKKITSLLKVDGSLIPVYDKYYHEGGFTNSDTLLVHVSIGWSPSHIEGYDIVGIRE